MTREEEIENKAIEKSAEYRFEQLYSYNNDVYSGFIQGAQWADKNPKSPWISVEDDLPCNHKELIHSNYTDRVLTMSRYGYTEVAFMCIIEDVWEWNTLITVLYWMPIPELPNE